MKTTRGPAARGQVTAGVDGPVPARPSPRPRSGPSTSKSSSAPKPGG